MPRAHPIVYPCGLCRQYRAQDPGSRTVIIYCDALLANSPPIIFMPAEAVSETCALSLMASAVDTQTFGCGLLSMTIRSSFISALLQKTSFKTQISNVVNGTKREAPVSTCPFLLRSRLVHLNLALGKAGYGTVHHGPARGHDRHGGEPAPHVMDEADASWCLMRALRCRRPRAA